MHGGFACVGSVCREDYPGLGLASNHSQHTGSTQTPYTHAEHHPWIVHQATASGTRSAQSRGLLVLYCINI